MPYINDPALFPPQRVFIDTLPPASLVLSATTPLAYAQLKSKLARCSHLRLLASSHNLAQTIPLAMHHRPDILLLAHHKPADPLLPLLTKLKKTLKGLSIILCLSEQTNQPDLSAPLKNLCEGILAPPYTSKQLARTIELVSCGYTVHMAPQQKLSINGQAAIQTITTREREILRMLCLGLSNREIARRLFLSESTVKSHTARLKAKLCTHNRISLALTAMRYGIV